MPVEFKDYYATLGVPRNAGEEDIKKSFRKLARRYHPDVAKDKRSAEEKFKEINEAYEVLGDPQKRKKYDELGANWKEGSDVQPPSGEQGRAWRSPDGAQTFEFHFGGTGFSDFFEQFFGRSSRSGFPFGENGFDAEQFSQSPGPARGTDIEGDLLVTLDEVLNGSVRSISLQRVKPGTRETEAHTFKVRIPQGVQDGRIIRIPGKGENGANGAGPGDLYLRVRLAAHPDFRVRGADLYYDLDLAPWEAVLGTTVRVPTLQGSANVRIPPGTSNGRQLRVRGRGLPKGQSDGERGDLYAVVNVHVPQQLNDEERALWEKLGRVSRLNPRQPA